MLLLVDAGNTRIKWALAEDGAPRRAMERQRRGRARRPEPPAGRAGRASRSTRAIVSNVAGPAAARPAAADAAARSTVDLVRVAGRSWRACATATAIRRSWAATASPRRSARARWRRARRWWSPPAAPPPPSTRSAPTAYFLGGMILPGLGLMAASLARNTAQLPQVAAAGALPPRFADNTDDAILSGCLSAQAGAIERACRAARRRAVHRLRRRRAAHRAGAVRAAPAGR